MNALFTYLEAIDLINEIINIGRLNDRKLGATVLNHNGNTMASAMDEDSREDIPTVSYKKAFTAHLAQKSTEELIKDLTFDGGVSLDSFLIKHLSSESKILLLTGGHPLKKGNVIVGFVGASGAGNGPLLEQMMKQAIANKNLN